MSLNFFDLNCMLGPTNANREPAFQSVAQLLGEMDRMDIGEALVYASLARFAHPADGNAWLMEAIKDEPRLHACWVGLPPGTSEQLEPQAFVAAMKAQGVVALRLMPVAHRYPLLEETLRPLLQALAAEKIPLLIDMDRSGWSEIAHDWRELFTVAREHPELPIVLLREGGTTARVLFSVWDRYPNIHLEASYIQEAGIIEGICRSFGADKLLFGTAMPNFDAGGPIASVLTAPVNGEQRADIAANNARRLLKLEPKPVASLQEWPCGEPDGFRVFDVHGHIGRWDLKYYSDWSARHMVERMDQVGIERFAVSDILAIGPDFRAGNDRVGAAVAEFPDRLAGYAVYNPNYESEMAEEMRRCFEDLGCSGIKLHCALHHTPTVDPSYRLAFETAHDFACPMLCHVQMNLSAEFLRETLHEFPGCKFIYAHVGGGRQEAIEPLLAVAYACPNFFFELSLSNIPRGVLAWLVQNAPVEQILYGSDHPLNGFSYQLGRVLYADIDKTAKRKILWDNAATIFNVQ